MAFWRKKKEINFQEELNSIDFEPPLEQRVELLEIEVNSLKELLQENLKKIKTLERLLQQFGGNEVYTKLSDNQRIYQAYDEGQEITQIAKKFQKGTGEIELILNLRNLK